MKDSSLKCIFVCPFRQSQYAFSTTESMIGQILKLSIVCIILAGPMSMLQLNAQEVRTINGVNNNFQHPGWGALGAPLERVAPVSFSDGFQSPARLESVNPREVSNTLFSQAEPKADRDNRSDYIWVFGQFMDHEITLVSPNQVEPVHIPVPACDENFDPNCDGIARIPMTRSTFKEGTGTDEGNPRIYVNEVTHWIDGSAVYGSTPQRSTWLRSFQDGKLKVSKGNLLPFNTITGEFNDAIDPEAPHMDNNNPYTSRVFVGGDVRTNENPNLAVMHTLWVREHNRICDQLKEKHPNWSDEELYQYARRIVGGLIQHITFDEWLPAMGIELDPYQGYQPRLNPAILLEFSAAAYRMGHTLVSSRIVRMDDHCDPMPSGNMDLQTAFFNPRPILIEEGIEPFLKGMSAQIQQHFDCKLIDDLRNFLFMSPEAGLGMDLASININRAREMGVADYNTIRASLGLEPIDEFSDICQDNEFNQQLADLFGSVDNIDPWVGFLAEEHMPGMLFGESVATILKLQFQRLRDADRFYYEIDPALTQEWIDNIKSTTMADIVLRNTSLKLMQDNIFFASPECDMSKIELAERHLEMKIYPNPTVDYFNLAIYGTNESEASYQITNSTGQIYEEGILQLDLGMNTFSMTLRNSWPDGVYSFNVFSVKEGRTNSQQILKVDQ